MRRHRARSCLTWLPPTAVYAVVAAIRLISRRAMPAAGAAKA